MPLHVKIMLVVLYFAALLCYGFDVYFYRIDAGDKKIRDSIRDEKHADTAFIHLSKKDLNMMNKQARELVQEVIDEVING